MGNLITVTSWQMGLAIYGGGFLIGALFAGIVIALDALANPSD